MKKKLICIFVSLLLCATIVSVAGTINNNENTASAATVDWWPMEGHDAAHTQVSTSAPPTNSVKWANPLYNLSFNAVSVADDYVFVSGNYKFRCLYASNGSINWETQIGGGTIPAIANGKVYVDSSMSGTLFCLDEETGVELWRYYRGGFANSPIVVGDYVYITSTSKGIYCLDATPDDNEDGVIDENDNDEGLPDPGQSYDRIWHFKPASGGYIRTTPAIADGKVYIANRYFYCLDALTGALLWMTDSFSESIDSTPTISEGYVYFTCNDKYLYCYDADPSDGIDEGIPDPSGSAYDLVWKYNTNSGSAQRASVAVVNNKVYFGEYCFDANPYDDLIDEGIPDDPGATYDLIWTTGSGLFNTPAVASGCVYSISYKSYINNELFNLDAETGDLNWQYTYVTDLYQAPPILANGFLYCLASYSNFMQKVLCFGGTDNPSEPIITGPSIGGKHAEYSFTIISSDPENDQLTYHIDWGDGDIDDVGPYASAEAFTLTHSWNYAGVFTIQVTANDSVFESDPGEHRINIVENLPPSIPEILSPQTEGVVNRLYSFTIRSKDNEGHDLTYHIDWGDETSDDYGPYDSEEWFTATHTWTDIGHYIINVTANDSRYTSEPAYHEINIIFNHAPVTPIILEAPSQVFIGEEFYVKAQTTDPDNHQIKYEFDSNGIQITTDRWYTSGETVTQLWQYSEVGIFNFSVRAFDVHNDYSAWSVPFQITVVDYQTDLQILDLTASAGIITAQITNTGIMDATDVFWKIEITGGFRMWYNQTNGTIAKLTNGEITNISLESPSFFGFGIGLGFIKPKPVVTVTIACADSDDKLSKEARIIGPSVKFS